MAEHVLNTTPFPSIAIGGASVAHAHIAVTGSTSSAARPRMVDRAEGKIDALGVRCRR